LKDGGWDCEFSIEEHETTGLTERAFYVPGIFPTAEAAIEEYPSGKHTVDGGRKASLIRDCQDYVRE
jgi:hypothetical protein